MSKVNYAAYLIALVVVGSAFSASASADSIDDAEAKQRGVSVEVVQLEKAQGKIKALEAQVEGLKQQLAASTQPKAATKAAISSQPAAIDFMATLGKMPAALQPKNATTPRAVQQRADWFTENLVGKTVTITVAASEAGTMNMMASAQNLPKWLTEYLATKPTAYLRTLCQFDNLDATTLPGGGLNGKIFVNDTVTLIGVVKDASVDGLTLQHCHVVSIKPPPK